MERRICFIGDSLVNGFNDSHYKGWTGRLCEAERAKGHVVTLYNLGIRGDNSHNIRKRWKEEIGHRVKPDTDMHLVFAFGVNDTRIEDGLMAVNLDESMENMHEIFSGAAKDFPILVIGPAPLDRTSQNRLLEVLSRQMGRLCAELQVPFLDMYSKLRENELWAAEVGLLDEVHPSDRGYDLYAGIVGSWDAWRAWFEE